MAEWLSRRRCQRRPGARSRHRDNPNETSVPSTDTTAIRSTVMEVCGARSGSATRGFRTLNRFSYRLGSLLFPPLSDELTIAEIALRQGALTIAAIALPQSAIAAILAIRSVLLDIASWCSRSRRRRSARADARFLSSLEYSAACSR
jgi:hypothetical protein